MVPRHAFKHAFKHASAVSWVHATCLASVDDAALHVICHKPVVAAQSRSASNPCSVSGDLGTLILVSPTGESG